MLRGPAARAMLSRQRRRYFRRNPPPRWRRQSELHRRNGSPTESISPEKAWRPTRRRLEHTREHRTEAAGVGTLEPSGTRPGDTGAFVPDAKPPTSRFPFASKANALGATPSIRTPAMAFPDPSRRQTWPFGDAATTPPSGAPAFTRSAPEPPLSVTFQSDPPLGRGESQPRHIEAADRKKDRRGDDRARREGQAGYHQGKRSHPGRRSLH